MQPFRGDRIRLQLEAIPSKGSTPAGRDESGVVGIVLFSSSETHFFFLKFFRADAFSGGGNIPKKGPNIC